MLNLFPVTAKINPADHLEIDGQDVCSLAQTWGTPLYLYDGATVRQNAQNLETWFRRWYAGESQVAYAAKVYFSLEMARKLKEMDIGVDAASLGELNMARLAGFAPGNVHLNGNNKSREELLAALRWGIQAVVVDSLEELDFLENLAAAEQRQVEIWLRVTPGISAKTHAYDLTAHPNSKFGLPMHDGQAAEAIRQALRSPWLRLTGLHTHIGSQIFELGPFRQAIEILYALAEAEGFVPQTFCPGGGWGVPYMPNGEAVPPAEDWIRTVSEAVTAESTRRGWPLPRLVVEPGRWLAARAGLAVYTIGTHKVVNDGSRVVAVDGGMADNPRHALYQAEYTALLADRAGAEPRHRVTLVGKFCESGDELIPQVMLPDYERGRVLVMPVAGAYQLSMASNYNLAPRPAALWLENGEIHVLQQRERIEESWWVS